MAKKDALVKVSGSVTEKEELYKLLSSLATQYKLYVICGGGAAVTEVLRKGQERSSFKDGRRTINSEEGRRLAAGALIKKKISLESELHRRGIPAFVRPSLIPFGNKICHINGDDLVVGIYHNFSRALEVTSRGTNKDSLRAIRGIEIVEL